MSLGVSKAWPSLRGKIRPTVTLLVIGFAFAPFFYSLLAGTLLWRLHGVAKVLHRRPLLLRPGIVGRFHVVVRLVPPRLLDGRRLARLVRRLR